MVSATRDRFRKIYSIEADGALARRAARTFANASHIQILEGDSKTLIPAILETLYEPALFWLDAGYYGWDGRVGDPTRLESELASILKARFAHVVLLDDARGLT